MTIGNANFNFLATGLEPSWNPIQQRDSAYETWGTPRKINSEEEIVTKVQEFGEHWEREPQAVPRRKLISSGASLIPEIPYFIISCHSEIPSHHNHVEEENLNHHFAHLHATWATEHERGAQGTRSSPKPQTWLHLSPVLVFQELSHCPTLLLPCPTFLCPLQYSLHGPWGPDPLSLPPHRCNLSSALSDKEWRGRGRTCPRTLLPHLLRYCIFDRTLAPLLYYGH